MTSEDIKVSIRYVAPMFRIRIEEPDGNISVYGGRSATEALTKLKAAREQLKVILAAQGLLPDPWEADLLSKVEQHVRNFCG